MTLKYKQDRDYLDRLLRYCLKRWQQVECKAHTDKPDRLKYIARADYWFAACDRVARLSRIAG